MNPYSPDLRQRVLAALRTHLDTQKDVAHRFSVCLSTVEKLADALHAVTRADDRAWFVHCGYVLP